LLGAPASPLPVAGAAGGAAQAASKRAALAVALRKKVRRDMEEWGEMAVDIKHLLYSRIVERRTEFMPVTRGFATRRFDRGV
jgi:hypothetical protein